MGNVRPIAIMKTQHAAEARNSFSAVQVFLRRCGFSAE